MVYRKTGGRIIAGPFTGLRFVYDSDGIPLVGCFAIDAIAKSGSSTKVFSDF